MSEKKYDFSKIEDQKEFEALPEEEREEGINEAHEEAKRMNEQEETDNAEIEGKWGNEMPIGGEQETGLIGEGEANIENNKRYLGEGGEKKERIVTDIRRMKEGLDDLEHDLKQYIHANSEFIEKTKNSFSRFSGNATNGNPAQLGFRQVMRMAEEITNPIKSHLGRMSEAQKYFAVIMNSKRITEELLEEAFAERDMGRVKEKMGIVADRCNKLIAQITEKTEELSRHRKSIVDVAEENLRRARNEFRRAQDTLKQNMFNSVLDTYQQASNFFLIDMKERGGKTEAFISRHNDIIQERQKEFRQIFAFFQNMKISEENILQEPGSSVNDKKHDVAQKGREISDKNEERDIKK